MACVNNCEKANVGSVRTDFFFTSVLGYFYPYAPRFVYNKRKYLSFTLGKYEIDHLRVDLVESKC